MYGDDNAQLIEYISWRFEFYKMDNNLLERIKTDITSNRLSKQRKKRIVWFLINFTDTTRSISYRDEKELTLMDIIGYDDHLYHSKHPEYDNRLEELEYKTGYGKLLKELELEIFLIRNTITSTLSSSNDHQEMVAKTIKATETLMKKPIIQDSGLSEPLETFKQKVLNQEGLLESLVL